MNEWRKVILGVAIPILCFVAVLSYLYRKQKQPAIPTAPQVRVSEVLWESEGRTVTTSPELNLEMRARYQLNYQNAKVHWIEDDTKVVKASGSIGVYALLNPRPRRVVLEIGPIDEGKLWTAKFMRLEEVPYE